MANIVLFDTAAATGSKFPSPAVRAELQALNPGNIAPNEVTTSKINDGAVTNPKIAAGAVDSSKIATNGVDTVNIKDGAVSGAKMQDASVTSDKAGIGILTSVNSAGDPISLRVQVVTTAEYNTITTPDPGTWYLITP